MKRKIVAMTLLAAMLVSTACSSGKTPESSTTATEAATTTTEATTAATTAAPETTAEETTAVSQIPETNLGRVAKAMLSAMGEDYYVFGDTDPNCYAYLGYVIAKDNKKVGIVDYLRLGTLSFREDDSREYTCFGIYEFDTNSKQYKSLSANSKFTAYVIGTNGYKFVSKKTKATVLAKNGPYVLTAQVISITGDKRVTQRKTPFSIGKAQEGYDAFKAYTNTSGENITSEMIKMKTYEKNIPDTNLGKVAQTILNALGDGYYLFSDTDPNSENYKGSKYAEANKSVGIKDVISVGQFIQYDDLDLMQVYVALTIYEFDTDSKEYKALANGKDFSYYGIGYDDDGNEVLEKYTGKVLAINGPYVLTAYAYTSSSMNSEQQRKAPFTIGKAQEGYKAFLAMKTA
jgi:hypothetical protein